MPQKRPKPPQVLRSVCSRSAGRRACPSTDVTREGGESLFGANGGTTEWTRHTLSDGKERTGQRGSGSTGS
jgi:hypothetical protein